MSRPLPWTEVIEALGEKPFQDLKAALEQAGTDVLDHDAFLLNGAVGALLKEIMPHDAEPVSVNAYATLLHMLYVCWSRGWPLRAVDDVALKLAIATPAPLTPAVPLPLATYVQLPENLVWAEPVPGAPHEPMDGMFVIADEGWMRALAVLGFRKEREGFTTAEALVTLPAGEPAKRADGSAPFSSRLPAGERAGLVSVADETELVQLGLLALSAARG